MTTPFIRTTLLATLLAVTTGCATTGITSTPPQVSAAPVARQLVQVPESDCDIRLWYNYQVVAIPKINQRWKEKGMSLAERAKAAFSLRHQARINARYMMADDVETLQARDLQKYGNPDGPTFSYLVDKGHTKGQPDEAIYKNIITSSSRTDASFNEECMTH